jgi:hypothetical protein
MILNCLSPSRNQDSKTKQVSSLFPQREKRTDLKKPPECCCKLPFQRNCVVFVMVKFEETASIILICDISFLPLIWSLKRKNPFLLPFLFYLPTTVRTPFGNKNSLKTMCVLISQLLTINNSSYFWDYKLFIWK